MRNVTITDHVTRNITMFNEKESKNYMDEMKVFKLFIEFKNMPFIRKLDGFDSGVT